MVLICISLMGFPGGSVGKESTCNSRDTRKHIFPGLGRSPGEANSNPVLGNPMDREAWRATFHVVTRVRHDSMTKPPPPHIYMYICQYNTVLIIIINSEIRKYNFSHFVSLILSLLQISSFSSST